MRPAAYAGEMEPADAGRRLARRHLSRWPAASPGPDDPARPAAFVAGIADREVAVSPIGSLSGYAETPRVGDWTLRSALVRLAQADPVRVSTLLEATRRLDAALHHASRALGRNPAICDRSLSLEGLGVDEAGQVSGQSRPYRDVRTADLARLVTAGLDLDGLLAGYDSGMAEGEAAPDRTAPLDIIERAAVPLLAVAVDLDHLAERLATWADRGMATPSPDDEVLDEIDRVTASTRSTLDALGVPEETGPAGRSAR